MTTPQAELASGHFLRAIPREFAREYLILSQGQDGEREIIVAPQAVHPAVVHNCGVRLGRPVDVQMVDEELIARCIDRAYELFAASDTQQENQLEIDSMALDDTPLDELLREADKDLLSSSGKAPLVRLVDRLLFQAVQIGASDLHIQPLAERIVVRQRVDGVLSADRELPPTLLRPLVSRIKVLGGMDVAERLVPQDGRCSLSIGARLIDVRISTLPTAHGERVVLRLLDSQQQVCDFGRLGMPDKVSYDFLRCAQRSGGIVLVTGPTGSGKTTTLYATLRELAGSERNIMTIEDPIEYELDGLGLPISQSQVNLKKGLNFANGLRHVLRQDPDVILVGEIRDEETARIAIQSSLTGHLVFSTLHTNDAVSAVSRLFDLGVEPYLVAASLSGVLAQRLVRLRCSACCPRIEDEPAADCSECAGSGFSGRQGVFEFLSVSEELRRLIGEGANIDRLRHAALSEGMKPLAQRGSEMVAQGRTTRAEVERAIHA